MTGMSLANSPYAAGIRQLLRKLDGNDVMGLAQVATNKRVVPQDTEGFYTYFEIILLVLTYKRTVNIL